MRRFLVVLLILIFPIIGYFVLQTGTNHYKHLPYFGPKSLPEPSLRTYHTFRGKKILDTVYYRVPDFTLINQDSNLVSLKSFGDQSIFVINFFWSRSTNLSPAVNQGIDSLVRQFRIHADVKFLSISLDPAHDSVGLLKQYAKGLKADTHRWIFLTGNQDSIFKISRESFFVNAYRSTTPNSSIIYTPKLILVDPSRHIRGYYDGTRREEIKKLRDEIIVLRYEIQQKETDIIQH